jgi:hypothetical protein
VQNLLREVDETQGCESSEHHWPSDRSVTHQGAGSYKRVTRQGGGRAESVPSQVIGC